MTNSRRPPTETSRLLVTLLVVSMVVVAAFAGGALAGGSSLADETPTAIDPTTGVSQTSPAPAATVGSVIDSCTEISESGRYILTSDITNDTDFEDEITCIEITADDVVLDGNGYEIEGTVRFDPSFFGLVGGTAIRADNVTNVTVQDVTLRSWKYGTRFRNVTDVRMQVTAYDYAALVTEDSEDIVVEDSVLRGVGTDLEADDVVVRRNDIKADVARRNPIEVDGDEAVVANNSIDLGWVGSRGGTTGIVLYGSGHHVRDNVLVGERPTRTNPDPEPEGNAFRITGTDHTIVRNRIRNAYQEYLPTVSTLSGSGHTVINNSWPQLAVRGTGSNYTISDLSVGTFSLGGSRHTVSNVTTVLTPRPITEEAVSLNGSNNAVNNVTTARIDVDGRNTTVSDSRAHSLSVTGRFISLVESDFSSVSLVRMRDGGIVGTPGGNNVSLVRTTVHESVSIEQSENFTFEEQNLDVNISVLDSTEIGLRNVTARNVSFSRSNNSTVSNVTAAAIDLQQSPDNTVRNSTAERIGLSSQEATEPFSDNNTVVGNTADLIEVVEDSRNNTIRDNDAAVRIAGDTSLDNVVIGNNASDVPVGIEIDGASQTTVENNTVSNTTRGIVLRGATGNPLVNNTAIDSGEWDYFATDGSTDNPVTDLTVGPTVSFDSHDVAIKKATDPPQPPEGKAGVGAFLVVNDTDADAWVDLTVQYTDADASGVDEESLRLWRYADGSWAPIGEDERLDTTENRVSAYVSGENFGIVAPLGNATAPTEPPQNTAPTITAIPDQAVAEGDSREVAVSAADADGDPITLSLSQAPDFVTLDDNGDGTGTITIDPATGDNGTYAVEVVADDGTAMATEGFNLTVVDGETTHTVELLGSGTYTAYDLVVSGEVTGGAGLNPADSFSGESASGTIIAGSDTYVFTGELTSVSIDDSATVEVDGEVVDPATLGQTEIEIVGNGEYTEYAFDVSGEVTGGEGLNAADSFSGASASGTVVGGSDTYTFTGEVRNLSVDGSATVRIREGE